MLTRRDFIHASAAAGIAATAVPAASFTSAPFTPDLPSLPIADALFDTRILGGERFAAALAADGANALSFTGDVSPLWRSRLMLEWRKGARPLAGFTTHGPLFILERMGWKHDMRATYRGQHRVNAEGFLEHELQGPVDVIERLEADLKAAGAEFAPVVAAALQNHPLGSGAQRHVTLTTQIRMDLEEPLYSYVLAPQCDCGGLKLYSHNHSA